MKIKAKNEKIVNMRLCVPVDGIITIGRDGTAEVSPRCAEALVKGTSDWAYFTGNVKPVEEKKPEKEAAPAPEKTEREKFVEGLDGMSFEELKAFAAEAKFPAEEYEKIKTKKLMKAYLLTKYDNATADADVEE